MTDYGETSVIDIVIAECTTLEKRREFSDGRAQASGIHVRLAGSEHGFLLSDTDCQVQKETNKSEKTINLHRPLFSCAFTRCEVSFLVNVIWVLEGIPVLPKRDARPPTLSTGVPWSAVLDPIIGKYSFSHPFDLASQLYGGNWVKEGRNTVGS